MKDRKVSGIIHGEKKYRKGANSMEKKSVLYHIQKFLSRIVSCAYETLSKITSPPAVKLCIKVLHWLKMGYIALVVISSLGESNLRNVFLWFKPTFPLPLLLLSVFEDLLSMLRVETWKEYRKRIKKGIFEETCSMTPPAILLYSLVRAPLTLEERAALLVVSALVMWAVYSIIQSILAKAILKKVSDRE